MPACQKLRYGYRWRTVRSESIGLKPVVLKVKVPRWLNTTTGEEFEQTPFVEAYTKITRALARGRLTQGPNLPRKSIAAKCSFNLL